MASILSYIPLLGRLGEVPKECRYQAAYETLATIIFATMPFWILPTLGYFIFANKPSLDEAFNKGEGLVFAAALLGPLVYVITKRYGRFRFRTSENNIDVKSLSISFPYGGAFATITALMCIISGFTYAFMRNTSTDAIDANGLQTLSITLMILAAIIFFLVTSYKNMLDELSSTKADVIIDSQPRQENDFLTEWLGKKS